MDAQASALHHRIVENTHVRCAYPNMDHSVAPNHRLYPIVICSDASHRTMKKDEPPQYVVHS